MSITSSTQVRYFLRDNGTNGTEIQVFKALLKAHVFDFEEQELMTEAAVFPDPQFGDEVSMTIYCESVPRIEELLDLIKAFEAR